MSKQKFCLLQANWMFPTSPANLFGAVRKYDVHTGIDIFAEKGTIVTSPFDGEVVKIGNFTGMDAEPTPSPWWNDTQYVIVKHLIPVFYAHGEFIDIYVLYGEINVNPELFVGQQIKEDEVLGTVVQVLKHNKGLPTSMLHVEMYNECPSTPAIWHLNDQKPPNLQDPQDFLRLCHKKHFIVEKKYV